MRGGRSRWRGRREDGLGDAGLTPGDVRIALDAGLAPGDVRIALDARLTPGDVRTAL
ncbi:hypothetical protein ABT039_29330 [Streptomyces lasiicapitis]|uniref:hypothetical protein n=1 Tax=Streptomyces lasiicapitis TaxID=1923961 RepID=UPI003322E563